MLLVVEWSDVVFAIDSIPAIFAITRDPFIVYTSNIFAIVGLRALFFVLAGAMNAFAYLKPHAAKPGTALEVFMNERWRPAKMLTEPAYDPQSLKPRMDAQADAAE